MEKRKPFYTLGGNVNQLVQPLWKTGWRVIKKTKNRDTI